MGKIIFFRYIMSEWIKHVKRFQAENGCSYKDALKHASATYQKGSGLRNMSDTGVSGFVANERLTTSKPPQNHTTMGFGVVWGRFWCGFVCVLVGLGTSGFQ
jgi:hypothetical protein